MQLDSTRDISPATMVSFGVAAVLAGIAVYNFVSGVYGGAIVSSIGAIIATLFGVLAT
ncbi:hypothetical protein NKF06_02905 [Haloferax sp. AB510]|uniref:hypothetical protein n=1 Tax=Haloferax sp. AB510 TaxID=2934172 RepID=UPI00209C09C3|nr:hypothetical protein [Haloferax sp. AB510]MCO8265564.1 hypothetical protein [Haloferax sp. AB510]